MIPASLYALLAFAPPQVQVSLSGKDQVVIPAERMGNYLRVTATVNGKPMHLIVDTGAGLNVLTWDAAKAAGIEGGFDTQAGGAGANKTPAKIVTVKEFQVGDAVVKGEAAVVLTLPEVLHCDGLVGYSFLKHFATTFDYDANTLTVRKSGSYKPAKGEVSGDMKIRANHPTVQGRIAGEQGWMVIDTGNNGTTNVYKWLVTKENLVKNWPTSSERVVGKGVGGEVKGYVAISPGFDVSGVSMPKGQITLDASGVEAFADPEILANVGAEHLRRLRMTLDYEAGKAFFGKSKAFDSPLVVDRSGLRIDSVDGKETVVGVVADAPGGKAGVKPGDVVLEINGKKASEVEPLVFTLDLRQAAGSKVTVKVDRGGQVMDFTFTLEDMVK
ncbi:MAG: aspartyl protease family protein [Armatimonadetes bacterium]|nr:aspartyl protease family protein [Armatimonadota bacterium]